MHDLYALVPRTRAAAEPIITLDARPAGNRQAVRANAMVLSDPGTSSRRSRLLMRRDLATWIAPLR